MPGIDTDEFMPEFWPADKILGLILDDQLQGIDAGKIVGQIVNDQVASLAAEKIEGKLTQAQIESIAAEQITGKLTNAQIAEIEAAKIVGKLTDSQLGGISAAKIIGELASGQIASLEALKITGQLTSSQIKELEASKIIGKLTAAQINTLTAAQVTGQLTNAQLAGLAAGKVEGLLTSEQIENLAVAKLVGQISESQIAAKAITAGKINVAELSAISVNAGLIEAGTFKGVTFETADGNTVLNKEGLSLKAGEGYPAALTKQITWTKLKEKVTKVIAGLTAYFVGEENVIALVVERLENSNSRLRLVSGRGSSTEIGMNLYSREKSSEISLEIGGLFFPVVMNDKKESNFLQLLNTGKMRVQFGSATDEWAGGTQFAKGGKITHLLETVPKLVLLTATTIAGSMITVDYGLGTEAEAKKEFGFLAYAHNVVPKAGEKVTFNWLVIG